MNEYLSIPESEYLLEYAWRNHRNSMSKIKFYRNIKVCTI